MVQTAHSLDPAKPGASLMSIDPINWRRYPGAVITKAMTDRAYVEPISFSGGAANQGAASDNDGEVGTINVTETMTTFVTQKAKAFIMGTTIAPDVGKSYHGTRGAIEPHEPYPSTNTAEVGAAFRRADYISPGGA